MCRQVRAEHAWKDGDSRAEVAAFVQRTIYVRRYRSSRRWETFASHSSATRIPATPLTQIAKTSVVRQPPKKILRRNTLTANMGRGDGKGALR